MTKYIKGYQGSLHIQDIKDHSIYKIVDMYIKGNQLTWIIKNTGI